MVAVASPTSAELAAVRSIILQTGRQQRIDDDVSSISTLLNLDRQSPLRSVEWYIPTTGKPSVSLAEAVARCRRIAAEYMQMRQEVGETLVNTHDKLLVQEALGHLAGWWSARADAWGDDRPASDPAAVAKAISAHFSNAYEAAHPVAEYFQAGRR
jgi:hypothetical protein